MRYLTALSLLIIAGIIANAQALDAGGDTSTRAKVIIWKLFYRVYRFYRFPVISAALCRT